MERILIHKVLTCNRTLYKIYKQQSILPVSVGFKIYKIMKLFDEVEEYVFNITEMVFNEITWTDMTEEQKEFYNNIISSEIELDYEKIDKAFFENNDKLMLTLEDIDNLSIIISEN
jgi:hypothetical protein